MGKELEAIGNWVNRIVLGFRCERLKGLEVLSFWGNSGTKWNRAGRNENSKTKKIGKSLSFNRRRLCYNNQTGLSVAYIYACACVSLPGRMPNVASVHLPINIRINHCLK